MTASPNPIVIAGAGIAGLSAAIALARAGRALTIYERDTDLSPEGAGLQLSPNASRHLREWGVLDALGDAALAPKSLRVRRAGDARMLAEMPLDSAECRWGAPYRVAHRADLMRALVTVLQRQPGAEIQRGVTVSGWSEEGGLRVDLSGQSRQDAEALIIADGIHSPLRQVLLGAASDPVRRTHRTAWRAVIPASETPAFAQSPHSNIWLGPKAHLVHYPLRGGAIVNVVAIIGSPLADEQDRGFWSRSGDFVELLPQFKAWHRDARTLLRAASTWRVWPLLKRRTPPHLSRGRVGLAGDAAHPMMPFLAQGAAQAIEDGAALGTAFRTHPEAVAALAAYSAARRSRAARVVSASERQGRIYHMAGPPALVRDLALRAMGPMGLMARSDWLFRAGGADGEGESGKV